MTYVRYGRNTESALGFSTALDMYKKAIVFDKADIGKLKICSNETTRHFMAKAVLVYELLRMKHRVVCEAKIEGIGVMDVFDIDTNVDYELESEKSLANSERIKEKYRQAGIELVIIQIRNWNDSLGWLQEYIRLWIRPD
jgi:hypothetical protein